MDKKQKIGITGSEGLIGSLLREIWKDKFSLKCFTLTKQSFLSTTVDFSKKEEVCGIFEGLDVIIHLAADSSPRTPWEVKLGFQKIRTVYFYKYFTTKRNYCTLSFVSEENFITENSSEQHYCNTKRDGRSCAC